MTDQIKNLMIGLFVLAAACIVIFILMFLHPQVGDKGKILHARFTNIDKVNIGTRVTYGGKPVGEVVDIREVEFGREGRKDASGHIYLYELDLEVDSNVNVYNSDEISLRTSGLLGEKNVEITPLAPTKGLELKQIDDKVIFAAETGSVEETFNDIKEVAAKIEQALSSVTEVVDDIRNRHIVKSFAEVMENIASISKALNKPQALSESLENIHRFTERFNPLLNKMDHVLQTVDQAASSGNDLFVRANHLLSETGDYIHKITSAEGTFFNFFMKDELYLRTNSILNKAETVLDDINHYGLLFNNDKGWQRLRARRLNLLQQLSSPQEFRNYFNDEIDQISTSISRVSMILDKVASDPYCYDRMQDREFTKVFAELMRRVSMLEEEVRLYNMQLVETQVRQTELEACCPLPCFQDSNWLYDSCQ